MIYIILMPKSSIEFQMYDYIEDHYVDTNNIDSDEDISKKLGEYIIHVFGRTLDGKSVYAKVTDFEPYFYIELPEKWSKLSKAKIRDNLQALYDYLLSYENKKIWAKFKSSLIDIKIINSKKAEGFTNDAIFTFARLRFNNYDGMKKFRIFFEENDVEINYKLYRFKTFEANLPPMFRCFHILSIPGCGWIETNKYIKIKDKSLKESYCDIEINVKYSDLKSIVKDMNAPFRIASYDIECFSHDGQFPQAERKQDPIIQIGITYTYLGKSDPYRQYIACLDTTVPFDDFTILKSFETEKELLLDFKEELIKSDCDIITGYNIFYFDEKYIYDRADKILNIKDELSMMSKLKNKTCVFKDMKLASSALGENLLRFWDMPGRVHIDLMKDIQKTFNLTCFKLDYVASYFIRGKIKEYHIIEDNNLKLVCESINDIYESDYIHLEKVNGFISDNIGDKYYVYKIDKDTKTLYIKGNSILMDELLDIKMNNIIAIKKETDEATIYAEKIYDENMKKIDIYIEEEQNKIKELFKNNKKEKKEYIKKLNDEIESKCEMYENMKNDYINKKISEATSKTTIFWSQAKDDVGPKEIFKFQKGTPENRSTVAKYCIKDCKLVNLLINKLEVVTKNIEMSNVCYVPLSYLFIRGQGIKIQSLCLKEFREQGYIFPVIKMQKLKICRKCNIETKGYNCPQCKGKNLEDVEIDESYEGAIVFDPIPTVDYEANVTKDYNSLYPSAIIQKNMSHETIVEDDKYDNLSDIEYYNAQFIEMVDNTVQYRRYAKKSDKLGVIPTILDKLLKERKAVKNQMEAEKDPFRVKILDAKQLALKVTANSLYGQLGASTSPVCKKDIAACTTSTGREMLILGKKYDEEILPWLMNGLKKALDMGNMDVFNKILKMELKNINNEEFITGLKKYLTENLKDKTIQPVVRYGDSVIGSTPLLLKELYSNKIIITTINKLGLIFNEMGNKESSELGNCETWTEHGWTRVQRVIRHKIDNTKKLYSVSTGSGFVVVTDEHSLLDMDCNKVEPKQLNIGSELLHGFPQIISMQDKFKNIFNSEIAYFNNQKDALFSYMVAKSCGHNPQVEYNNNKWSINTSQNKQGNNMVTKIEEWLEEEEYVYDLTTDNHHFQAGVGSLIVHNTDSNFSCYRLRENVEKVDDDTSMELWKEIINFSRELIKPFIPDEHIDMWCDLHNEYYGSDKITGLYLPEGPTVLPEPTHWKIILPIEERLKQYLKEYMEESYLSWLWILQEIVMKNHQNKNYKLCKWAQHQMNKIRLIANDLTDEHLKSYTSQIKEIESELNKIETKIKKEKTEAKKLSLEYDEHQYSDNIKLLTEDKNEKSIKYKIIFDKRQYIESYINDFVNKILKDYWIQPYWDIKDDKLQRYIEIYKGGKSITDKRSLDLSMDIGKISGELIRKRLPFPHNFAYEKTFWPFLILCKKKYVGNKYEMNPNKYKQDFMGIVLKRRDNAPIVKEICGGIVDILINKRDPDGAKEYLQKCLDNMFEGKYDIKYFLQSRSLKEKESYKDWTRIAHVYLADKIAIRDPGNKPQSGDRIEFAVVKVDNPEKKKMLQGELIETPQFIKQNNLEIDYLFYMTNQIQNPATQFLELVDDKIGLLFEEYKNKYGTPKKIREKKVKEVKVKEIKVKVVKEKEVKEKKTRAPRKKITNVECPEQTKPVKKTKKNIIDNIDISKEIMDDLKNIKK
jgi:DNA polymerase elongation subunit (family B)